MGNFKKRSNWQTKSLSTLHPSKRNWIFLTVSSVTPYLHTSHAWNRERRKKLLSIMKNMAQWLKNCVLFVVIVSGIFETLEVDFNIFSDSFSTVVDQSPVHLQLELIDMQSDNDMKRVFGENDLVSFYKNYVRGKHPNLAEHAFEIISLFGSTYCCE